MSTGRHRRLSEFLAADHERLDQLLRQALADPDRIDGAYEQFRVGLLHHIAMEEKVLLPDARRRGGETPAMRQIHADHAALAALLVPTPTHAIVAAIADILETHNQLEEGPDGVYAYAEQLAGLEADNLLAKIEAIPSVRVAPHVDSPAVDEHIAQLLRARATRE
jgi:hypothetical protein